jgi:hypothetical protein
MLDDRTLREVFHKTGTVPDEVGGVERKMMPVFRAGTSSKLHIRFKREDVIREF